METVKVEMTAEEKAQFEAFQKAQERKKAEQRAKQDRDYYNHLVDEEIATSIPLLLQVSENIKKAKQQVLNNFKGVLELKSSLFKTKAEGQRSHTFTTR